MINHHYAISPAFHSCCRVFCDIEWSLSQKGIYVSLHGWIIAKCVQKKLWTFEWGGWIYCNDSMNATLIFISQISRTDSLGREAFAHYPPTLEPPPLGIYCPISVSILQSWYTPTTAQKGDFSDAPTPTISPTNQMLTKHSNHRT